MGDQSAAVEPSAGQHGVEQNGVDTIPEDERTARPRDIVGILWGGNLALSVMVFGWLAILYGLSWWQAVSAILVGTLVGSIAVMPLALLGYRAATNNSVTSGAYFGVRGRLVASVIGLLLCLGYIALTVWTGGEAIVSSLSRATGTEATNAWLALGYAVIAIVVAVVAVYGFRWLVTLNKLIVPVVGLTMVLSLVAFAPDFDSSYPGAPELYALGEFWPTWLLAALTAGIAGPISYVTLTGDWTRYVSSTRHSARSVLGATWLGLFVGLAVPTLFGAFISVVAFDEFSFVGGFAAAGPAWLVLPILATGVVGSLGQGGINLYSMGLDLDAILPRLTRTQATFAVTGIALALVFLGKFVWDIESSVTLYVLFLTSLATPWAVITMIGYARTGGRFDRTSLQVFNRRETGGAYWFFHGWNIDAVIAWAVGSIVGVLSNSTETYVGPIAERLNGLDASVLTSAVAAGVVYLLLVLLRPHAHAAARGK